MWFWSNHFCISADKIQSMSGAYEREAIRPHVLGRFGDMLQAVESHPAMLFYLDQAASMGPNSIAGINRTRGLNENLAREILELHTLGVRTGYTQDDVIRFANVLTGWTFLPAGDNPEHGGEFTFNRRLHEPGPQKVVDKVYEDTGVEQGRAVLRDLAVHPSTATHVATKLVRYFIADEPPPALVERLAQVFRDTGGDLKEVTKALVTSSEAWTLPRTKLKRPSEWVVSHGARYRDLPGGRGPLHRRARAFSASPCGARRRPRATPTTRRPGSTAWAGGWTSPTTTRSAWRPHRSPVRDGHGPRVDRVARREAGRRARREPAAGARPAVHVARIPEEVIHDLLHAICPAAARR